MAIKPPSNVGVSGTNPAPHNVSSEAASAKPAAASSPPVAANPEAIAKALKDYQKIVRDRFKKPLLSGAAGLFTDSVMFPADLLDPNNPVNDPKYLHLLSALLGMKELERFFKTKDQSDEDEEESDDQTSEPSQKETKEKKNTDH
jgi:hypothetical protein